MNKMSDPRYRSCIDPRRVFVDKCRMRMQMQALHSQFNLTLLPNEGCLLIGSPSPTSPVIRRGIEMQICAYVIG